MAAPGDARGSKQLLPVYDKPMIDYELTVLMLSGSRHIQAHDPVCYGVAEFDDDGSAGSLEEKPNRPRSNWAVIGRETARARKTLRKSGYGERLARIVDEKLGVTLQVETD